MMFLKTDSARKAAFDKKIILQSQHVFLRAPCLQDYAEWSHLRAKNKNFLKPYEPQWAADSLEKSAFARRLKKQAEEVELDRGRFFLIFNKQNESMVGGININDIRYSIQQCATLGYWLAEDHQGKGYMKEAAQAVIEYSFNTLNLNRLNAACLPDNDRSINLLKSLGFMEEGFAPRYLKINNQWQDHRLFGLCRDSQL